MERVLDFDLGQREAKVARVEETRAVSGAASRSTIPFDVIAARKRKYENNNTSFNSELLSRLTPPLSELNDTVRSARDPESIAGASLPGVHRRSSAEASANADRARGAPAAADSAPRTRKTRAVLVDLMGHYLAVLTGHWPALLSTCK